MRIQVTALAAVTPVLADFTFQQRCLSFAPEQHVFNATRTELQYVTAGTNISFPDHVASCSRPAQVVEANMCRVAMSVPTSNRSSFTLEMWLPEAWTGRVLATGNGGVDGCVHYEDVAYGAENGFATVGTNNGHNGTGGTDFYINDEVVADFAWRALHTSIQMGKNLSGLFYDSPANKSYYIGCSLGGRMGLGAAEMFPDDFDGILAGSPAADFNNLYSWRASFYPTVGPANGSDFITADTWKTTIHNEVLAQCDSIDGVTDGIIEDPTLCKFQPSKLLCGPGNHSTNCLSQPQVNTLTTIFRDYLWPNNTLLFPAMQPGSELGAAAGLYSGSPWALSVNWFKYAVLSNPSWDPLSYSLSDALTAAQKDPGGIRTWPSSLSTFEQRGGKILTYHGLQDPQITSFNSIRLYHHLSDGMGYEPAQMDGFYRFFRIAGMNHCTTGPGAWVLGQGGSAASFARGMPFEGETNMLAALVRWVEEGKAPEEVVGTKFVNDTLALGVAYRHRQCRYPLRSTYNGEGDAEDVDSWECRAVEEGCEG